MVRANLKRAVCAVLVSVITLFTVTASAATAGTSTDPLISALYLTGAFTEALKADISRTLGGAADGADAALGVLGERVDSLGVTYGYAPEFTRVSLSGGDTIKLMSGSSFVPLSGTAALTDVEGVVIDVSTGSEAARDLTLESGSRYFCAEDTTAAITAGSDAAGLVDGYYLVEISPDNRLHPVFKDVRQRDWFYPAVDFAYTNSLFNGTSPDTFSPGAFMTRAMFVTVLYRFEGQPAVTGSVGFTDVGDSSLYYYNAAVWASANEIVLGHASGAFAPDDPVTREQMTVIMHRYNIYKNRVSTAPESALDVFGDKDEVSEYAGVAMRWAVSLGVINGADGRLSPKNTATRAQVAQIISNYSQI